MCGECSIGFRCHFGPSFDCLLLSTCTHLLSLCMYSMSSSSAKWPLETLEGKLMEKVKCPKLGGTYYGVVPVGWDKYLLHGRFVVKGKEQQQYALASEKPINFSVKEDQVLLNYDGACHNLFAITDDGTIPVLNQIFSKENVAYAIGGQHSSKSQLAGRDGIHLFTIDNKLQCKRATFVINGRHEGVVELRPKFQGQGEFDGQSAIHYSVA